MTAQKLRFSNYDIVFQEVPGEVTLAINITGCPHRCFNCHSPYLWDNFGEVLLDELHKIIAKYSGMITCVAFMGGEQNKEELKQALSMIRAMNLKTCLYSGADTLESISGLISIIDYLKIGRYIDALGGLSNPNTNQRFYSINNKILTDITSLFQRKKEEI